MKYLSMILVLYSLFLFPLASHSGSTSNGDEDEVYIASIDDLQGVWKGGKEIEDRYGKFIVLYNMTFFNEGQNVRYNICPTPLSRDCMDNPTVRRQRCTVEKDFEYKNRINYFCSNNNNIVDWAIKTKIVEGFYEFLSADLFIDKLSERDRGIRMKKVQDGERPF